MAWVTSISDLISTVISRLRKISEEFVLRYRTFGNIVPGPLHTLVALIEDVSNGVKEVCLPTFSRGGAT